VDCRLNLITYSNSSANIWEPITYIDLDVLGACLRPEFWSHLEPASELAFPRLHTFNDKDFLVSVQTTRL
jgi:hypothetical protein